MPNCCTDRQEFILPLNHRASSLPLCNNFFSFLLFILFLFFAVLHYCCRISPWNEVLLDCIVVWATVHTQSWQKCPTVATLINSVKTRTAENIAYYIESFKTRHLWAKNGTSDDDDNTNSTETLTRCIHAAPTKVRLLCVVVDRLFFYLSIFFAIQKWWTAIVCLPKKSLGPFNFVWV